MLLESADYISQECRPYPPKVLTISLESADHIPKSADYTPQKY